ncbi:hypothetical protein D3OALGA1CA_2887 [Olavius algarvensis associated proteobacterium Delta 3]|nr:hypothetical protein D3OALGB2SA_2722 [Olavius algarvensis associated proteobacterium Delta 3]CAB5125822.1 hypothetical protein D3OALGA1CA_2887 [Olavius algarvensis associated proteobacterium Delta 3]
MRTKIILLSLLMVLAFSENDAAAMMVIGTGEITSAGAGNGGQYQLIYHEALDITWLDFSRSADNWNSQMDWASNLEVEFNGTIFNSWRLPSSGDNPFFGHSKTTSEMGHLYYLELDNGPGDQTINTGEFENLLPSRYWSSTEYSPSPEGAWEFDFEGGLQSISLKTSARLAIAVLDGDLSTVPIPGSVWLFGTSILGLAGIRRKMNS